MKALTAITVVRAGLAMILVVPTLAQPDRPVASVVLHNLSSAPIRDVPVSFGQVFKRGDIAEALLVRANEATAQVDITRRHPDGSVRFAVVTLLIPELAAGGDLRAEFYSGKAEGATSKQNIRTSDLLQTDFDVTVKLRFPDGTERGASARALLQQAGDDARRWLTGPLVTEWLLSGAPTTATGEPDPDLRVQFEVRAYTGCKAVRVSVTVENCLDTWSGNIGYDVSILLGKSQQPVYEKKAVHHRPLSRWRKIVWWPALPPEITVVHSLEYLSATGALPNYDRSVVTPDALVAKMAASWATSSETDIMGSGSLTKYMPTTGGRQEIGPYPSWAVRYLLTMDPRLKAIVLGNGDLAGSWPIHVRSSKTGRIMTLDERPNFWLRGYKDNNGYERPHWQPHRTSPPDPNTPEGKKYTLTPDVAHQGSFAYIPYLVTGDFYYLEEAYFWANYCLLAQWNAPRQNARGIMSDQVRGNAWGLRNIGDAAFIATDGDPELAYFEEKIHNNMAHMTAKMYGPPEYSRMGFWRPRDTRDARIQNPANPDWLVMVWWEHDYLIWALHHLAELGFADAARPRDFLLRWRVGSFVNPNEFDPRLSAPYRTVIGEKGPDGKPIFYENWKKLAEENLRLGNKPSLATYGGSYTYSARMAVICGVDAGFPRADEALKWLNSNLPDIPKAISADPVFAIAPKTTVR